MQDYIRSSYPREFVESLKVSPAWNLFIQVMVDKMSYVQDQIRFKMNGFEERQSIDPNWVISGSFEGPVLLKNQIIQLRIDTLPTEIYCNCAEISLDGTIYKKYQIVEGDFYLRFTRDVTPSEVLLMPRNFYPNHPIYRDVRDVMDVVGVFDSAVTDSDFFNKKSATSPYLINYFLQRSNVPYSIEYFYKENEDSVEAKGTKEMTVVNGVTLIPLEGSRYLYKTRLNLIAGSDYLKLETGVIQITSVDVDTLTLETPVSGGRYSVLRKNYLVGLSPKNQLVSAIEIEYDKEDYEFMQRFIPRVIPVRCLEGFKGFVSVRVRTEIKIIDQPYVNPVLATDLLSLAESISFDENRQLYAGDYMLFKGDTKVYDSYMSQDEYEEILLD